MLRRIFESELDEITGEYRKLHNAEQHALYSDFHSSYARPADSVQHSTLSGKVARLGDKSRIGLPESRPRD